MRSSFLSDKEWVKRMMNMLCDKAGCSLSHPLTQRDLDFLCESIAAASGTQISLSTLKRLFNGQFSKLPQVATLNAIAIYIGYQHWQDFKFNNSNAISSEEQNRTAEAHPANSHKWIAKIKSIGLLFILVVSGVIVTAMLIHKQEDLHFEKAHFSVHKITQNEIPNTVVFDYNVDEVNADSFFIQQSWDRNRRVRIYKNNYSLTDIYYEPGYHTAKLIANDQVIKTFDISIPTDRWFFMMKDNLVAEKPTYIDPAAITHNGSMGLTIPDLISHDIPFKQKEKTYIYTFFPSTINVSSDNFRLRGRLRLLEIRNNLCPQIMLEVFSQRYFMYFKTSTKGCSGELSCQFGDKILNGNTTDLSPLGCDITNWFTVELIVKNKDVTIILNNDKVFSLTYDNSAGLITGLGFISNGLCEIDQVSLESLDGVTIYSNDFEDTP